MSYQEAPISFTVKVFGNLFSVRGESAQDFTNAVSTVTGESPSTVSEAIVALQTMADHISGVTLAKKELGGKVVETRDATPAEQAAASPAAPAGQFRTDVYVWEDTDPRGNPVKWEFNRPDAPAVPDRPHLKMALKAGTNASGKTYRGWFDPASAYQQGFPKGADTKPIFKDVPAA